MNEELVGYLVQFCNEEETMELGMQLLIRHTTSELPIGM